MEPTRKKRRRWQIVAFVLVFLSLGSWWYWPRGDARFVGNWRVRGSTNHRMYTFLRNGTGIETTNLPDDGVIYRKRHFTWNVADGVLNFCWREIPPSLAYVWYMPSASVRELLGEEESCPISSVTVESIAFEREEFHCVLAGPETIFESIDRIPE